MGDGLTKIDQASLSNMLYSYADDLKNSLEFKRQYLKEHPRFLDFQIIFRRKLLSYVDQATGNPNFSLVADLLNGALLAADVDTYVSASSLRNLYIRPQRPHTAY